jgi:hypothetical protein
VFGVDEKTELPFIISQLLHQVQTYKYTRTYPNKSQARLLQPSYELENLLQLELEFHSVFSRREIVKSLFQNSTQEKNKPSSEFHLKYQTHISANIVLSKAIQVFVMVLGLKEWSNKSTFIGTYNIVLAHGCHHHQLKSLGVTVFINIYSKLEINQILIYC